MADLGHTDGRASHTPRWRRLALFAIVIGVAIGMSAMFVARRDEWAGKPRGRVFIETPLNLTGLAEIDSVAANLTRQYQKLAASVALPIPDDSVKAIERLVSTLPGVEGPRERLARANAQIAVMTLVNIQHDSLRVFVALQRDLRGGVLESWPISLRMAPLGERNHAVAASAVALSRALRSMRSCDARDHLDPTSPPWCWRKENESDVVPGYSRTTRGVRTASR